MKQELIIQAILRSDQLITIDGFQYALPSPQTSGTQTQKISCARVESIPIMTLIDNNKKLLDEIVNQTIKKNGVTANMLTAINNFTSGYVVGLKGYDVVTTKEDFREDLKSFTINNSKILNSIGYHFGAWVYDGFIWLDVSIVENNRLVAIKKGLINEQKAIFDNANKKSINLL